MEGHAIAPEHRPEALGQLLVERGKLPPDALERALRLQAETCERLNVILGKLGLVSDRDMTDALAAWLDLPVIGRDALPDMPVLEESLGPRFLREARLLPLEADDTVVTVAMADPLDGFVLDAVRLATGRSVRPAIALPADIEAALERIHGGGSGVLGEIFADDAPGGGDDETGSNDVERLRDLAGEAPVIRFVEHLIREAILQRASDIHIEPYEGRVRVRYRIDGRLRDTDGPPHRLRAAVASRIKLMARLNIAETRLPQDGRIRLVVRGRQVDLRVSTVPAMHGESIVLRVLDREGLTLDLAGLGFAGPGLDRFLRLLDEPTGIVLVTGPTGSGKTTTLYAALGRLNTDDRKILTVEDPVEYELEGVNQVQVRPKIDLTFANALRSLLRQDPDVIMIGEIRDGDSAEIAARAALTGHKVLSTLHTNDAASAVTRLLDMRLEDYLVTSTLNGILAQRLVRALCPDCRAPATVLPDILERAAAARAAAGRTAHVHRAVGCRACGGSGYRGRTTISEVLEMSDTIRNLVLRHAEAHDIRRAAAAEGMSGMFEEGVEKVLDGVTTLEEVLRVTRDA